jgi:arylsulfatase A-like enzyme
VKWPGKIAQGKVSDIPVITMDWIPTILEYLGETGIKELDGNSLAPVFLNSEEEIPRDLFWHFPHYRGSDVVPYAIVRSGDFKLIYYFDGSEAELFDLKNDPGESRNLIKSDPKIADELLGKLDTWFTETNARLPVRLE